MGRNSLCTVRYIRYTVFCAFALLYSTTRTTQKIHTIGVLFGTLRYVRLQLRTTNTRIAQKIPIIGALFETLCFVRVQFCTTNMRTTQKIPDINAGERSLFWSEIRC